MKDKKTALQKLQSLLTILGFLVLAVLILVGLDQEDKQIIEGEAVYSNPLQRNAPGTEQQPTAVTREGNPRVLLVALRKGLFPSGGIAAFLEKQHPEHRSTMFAWGLLLITIGLFSLVVDKGNDGKIQLWWAWVVTILAGIGLIFFL